MRDPYIRCSNRYWNRSDKHDHFFQPVSFSDQVNGDYLYSLFHTREQHTVTPHCFQVEPTKSKKETCSK